MVRLSIGSTAWGRAWRGLTLSCSCPLREGGVRASITSSRFSSQRVYICCWASLPSAATLIEVKEALNQHPFPDLPPPGPSTTEVLPRHWLRDVIIHSFTSNDSLFPLFPSLSPSQYLPPVLPPCSALPQKACHMAKRRVEVKYSPSYSGPMRPEAVLLDRALCLPTFSHFLIANKTSLPPLELVAI